MELKVWVDGIQRVVCGLTEDTTCQDVVVALALATKQTGRFTLVEKWRNNERFVSPNEKLLDALAKWGEYTNDVHFLLRKSPSKSTVYNSHSRSHHNSTNNHNHPHHRHTNGRPLDREKGASKTLDSLFKQINGRNSSLSSFSSESPTSTASLKGTPSPPALNLADDKASPSSSSSNPSISALKSCDQSSSSKEKFIVNSSFCQATHLEDGSFNGANNSNSLYTSCERSSSPDKCIKETSSSSSPSCDSQSPQSHRTRIHPSHAVSADKVKSYYSSFHSDSESQCRQPVDKSPSLDTNTPLNGEELIASSNNSPARQSERPRDPLRIVSSYQSNALLSQDLIDKSLHREIEESVAGHHVDPSKTLNERINSPQTEHIRKQVHDIYSSIARVESDTLACQEKIQLLTQQIEEEQSLLQMKRIQQEEQGRLNELKKAFEEKENILSHKKTQQDQVEDELRQVSDELKSKREEVDKLEKELRQENLNALSIEPTAECSISHLTSDASTSAFIKLHSDIKRPLSSVLLGTGFYNRIGSTRKIMGYPRSLQTTAPTKKNPQGVWV